jgi:hypothetical protein
VRYDQQTSKAMGRCGRIVGAAKLAGPRLMRLGALAMAFCGIFFAVC